MKVSWDYEIPNIWKNKIHVPNHHFIPTLSAALPNPTPPTSKSLSIRCSLLFHGENYAYPISNPWAGEDANAIIHQKWALSPKIGDTNAKES
jgi:hypothetical protein